MKQFLRLQRQFSTKNTLPAPFDPRQSKYSGQRREQNLALRDKRADAPEYLRDEQNFKEVTE